jgi:hypothetical protein
MKQKPSNTIKFYLLLIFTKADGKVYDYNSIYVKISVVYLGEWGLKT